MPGDKQVSPSAIVRMALAGVVATAAALEWGGSATTKLIVVTLTFILIYALFRTWGVADDQ